MNIDDLSAVTGFKFTAILTDRGEWYARTQDGAIIVAPSWRGVRVTVFGGSEVVRRSCPARVFAVADTIQLLCEAL